MEGPRLCHGHLVQLGPGQGELVALQLEGDWLTSLASGHGSPSQGGQLSNAHYLPSCVRACVRACVCEGDKRAMRQQEITSDMCICVLYLGAGLRFLKPPRLLQKQIQYLK